MGVKEEDEEPIKRAMEAMGWDTSSGLPMANEENRQLLDEWQRLFAQKIELIEIDKQNVERVNKIQQHTKNAENTINHNLKLLDAYQSEVRTESHLLKLAIRSHSKLKEDVKNLNKEQNNYQKFIDNTEKEMCRRKNGIEKLTNRIQWAKTSLQEWQEAMEEGNRGYELIDIYFKEDQMKAVQLTQTRQKLQNDIDTMRRQLIVMYDEQKTLECNLDCTANLYRAAHTERRKMVNIWKSAVKQMIQCEENIRNTEMDLLDKKALADKKQKQLQDADTKLSEMIATNRNVEMAIEELNSESSDLRDQIQKLADLIILKTNEVDLLQRDLQNLSQHVEQQRLDNREKTRMKSELLQKLTEMGKLVEALNAKLEEKRNEHLTSNQRLQRLEDMMAAEEKIMKQLNDEIASINGVIYRSQEQMAQYKSDETVIHLSCEGYKASISAISRSIENSDKELKRQMEMHYTIAFKVLESERTLLQLQGGLVDPQREERNKQYLKVLEEERTKLTRRHNLTQQQNKKLDDDMRQLTNTFNADMKDLENVNFMIKEAEVYYHGSVKRVKEEKQCNQELIVELSFLKLRVIDFNNYLDKCTEGTYNLIKHRAVLRRTIKDRLVEVKSQMELLCLKKKHLQEEISTLKADIGERNKHLQAVKARFDLTSKLLGVNPDGSLITATQLRVETAQEKQLLLDEGSDLNEMVLKTEKEVKAMENTLAILTRCNDQYRKEVMSLEGSDEAKAELKELQELFCKEVSRLKCLRHQYGVLRELIRNTMQDHSSLKQRYNIVGQKRDELLAQMQKLEAEHEEQNSKLRRAERDLKLAQKALRQKEYSASCMELIERDLDLKDLENRNYGVLHQLSSLTENDYVVGPKLYRALLERDIKLPHMIPRTRSMVSCRSGSTSATPRSSVNEDSQSTSRSLMSGTESEMNSSARVSVISLQFDQTTSKGSRVFK